LIIGSHSCTEPKKLAKVGREDFEKTDLTGVVKNKKQKQNTAQQPGGLKIESIQPDSGVDSGCARSWNEDNHSRYHRLLILPVANFPHVRIAVVQQENVLSGLNANLYTHLSHTLFRKIRLDGQFITAP